MRPGPAGRGRAAFSEDEAAYIDLGERALMASGMGELGQNELDRVGSGRKLGLASDARGRFERGVDPKLALQVKSIASELAVPEGEVARTVIESGFDLDLREALVAFGGDPGAAARSGLSANGSAQSAPSSQSDGPGRVGASHVGGALIAPRRILFEAPRDHKSQRERKMTRSRPGRLRASGLVRQPREPRLGLGVDAVHAQVGGDPVGQLERFVSGGTVERPGPGRAVGHDASVGVRPAAG